MRSRSRVLKGRRTKRCTGAAGVVGFEVNVDRGRPVIVLVRNARSELITNINKFSPPGIAMEIERWLDPWCQNINKTISSAIVECWPRDWIENDITTSILRALRAKHRRTLLKSIPDNLMFIVEWDAFKLRGAIEENCGDVAVLVRHHHGDPEPLEGVGYFEAKRIYDTDRFDGISSWEQLELMRRNVPHHHVVLYDYEPCQWNVLRPISWERAWRGVVNCFALPTNKILALRKKTRDLYRHSISLTDQLCLRYIQGFDLEYDPYLIAEAKGFISPRGGPSFLLVANVAISDGEEPLELPPTEELRISHDFIPLGDDQGQDRPDRHH